LIYVQHSYVCANIDFDLRIADLVMFEINGE